MSAIAAMAQLSWRTRCSRFATFTSSAATRSLKLRTSRSTSTTSSIGSVRTSDGKRRGPGVHSPFARLALAAFLPLALAGCSDLRETAARDVLRDAGYERLVISPEPWLLGPCQWTELYAVRFVGTKDGERWDGVMCATGEHAQDARVIAVRVIPQPSTWDSFGRGRR